MSAIQYQDFFRHGSINSKEAAQNRMIPFPKILIFELVDYQCEYPKYYIRIYEKKTLDSKIQSKNIYLYLKGKYDAIEDDEDSRGTGRTMKVDYNEHVQ